MRSTVLSTVCVIAGILLAGTRAFAQNDNPDLQVNVTATGGDFVNVYPAAYYYSDYQYPFFLAPPIASLNTGQSASATYPASPSANRSSEYGVLGLTRQQTGYAVAVGFQNGGLQEVGKSFETIFGTSDLFGDTFTEQDVVDQILQGNIDDMSKWSTAFTAFVYNAFGNGATTSPEPDLQTVDVVSPLTLVTLVSDGGTASTANALSPNASSGASYISGTASISTPEPATLSLLALPTILLLLRRRVSPV